MHCKTESPARIRMGLRPPAMALALAVIVVWQMSSRQPAAYGQQATATNPPTATRTAAATITATAAVVATPAERLSGRFEEQDPRLVYAGSWTTVNDPRASGGSLRRSSAPGSTLQVTFFGSDVRWLTARGPDRGVAHVFIDDQDKGVIDLYAPAEQYQQEFTFSAAAGDQNHALRIEVTGQRGGAATGANVDVDALSFSSPVSLTPLRFEDNDPAVVYSGNWASVDESRASGGVVHRSNQATAAAQLAFSGATVVWVTSKGPDRGTARVLIDGAERDRFDLFSAAERFGQEVRYDGLSSGPHVIRIEVAGVLGGASTNSFVDVDAFVVSDAPATPVPTATVVATTTPLASATALPTVTPTASAGPIPTATPVAIGTPPPAQRDTRFFAQTSFRIDHEPFWAYFNARGGTQAFGFPVSRTLRFLGCTTQIFQRHLMQQCGDGAPVQTMNLLDPELMPYNQINFATFPAHDPVVASSAPAPGAPNYGEAVLRHVRATAPDTFDGLPSRFYSTFVSTVPSSDPASDPDLAVLLNLEIWGFPTSDPALDPHNRAFLYQRFQRGIMHFDASTGVTQGILLADYFKSVLLGRDVPADLAAQAAGSRFLAQYCPGSPQWVCRPAELSSTDLTFAFEPQ